MKTAFFERFDLDLPDEAVRDCYHPGPCDDDVAYWQAHIIRPESITPEKLKEELYDYGAWDDEELSDDEANWKRIIWLAAGQIQDNPNDTEESK